MSSKTFITMAIKRTTSKIGVIIPTINQSTPTNTQIVMINRVIR